MKQTQNEYQKQKEIENVLSWLSMKKSLEEKVRINIYLPKAIVNLIDSMAKEGSRGNVISSLVIKEVKKTKQLPFGMFSGAKISEKEIDEIISHWDKAIHGLK